jgi:chromatin remodeling complex protein RSC6
MAKSTKKAVQEVQQVDNKAVDTDVQVDVVEPEVMDEKTALRLAHYEELVSKIENTLSELKSLKTDLGKFHKLVEKDIAKANKGRRRVNRDRSPTGFGKAGVVPEGLRTLLGISEDKHMTRPEVTNMLYAYLDEHKLRDPEDKRIMRTNPALSKAFGLTPEQVKSINSYKKDEAGKVEKNKGLNFYNIQKYVAALYKGQPIAFDMDSSEDEKEEELEQVVETKGKGRAKGKVNVV